MVFQVVVIVAHENCEQDAVVELLQFGSDQIRASAVLAHRIGDVGVVRSFSSFAIQKRSCGNVMFASVADPVEAFNDGYWPVGAFQNEARACRSQTHAGSEVQRRDFHSFDWHGVAVRRELGDRQLAFIVIIRFWPGAPEAAGVPNHLVRIGLGIRVIGLDCAIAVHKVIDVAEAWSGRICEGQWTPFIIKEAERPLPGAIVCRQEKFQLVGRAAQRLSNDAPAP